MTTGDTTDLFATDNYGGVPRQPRPIGRGPVVGVKMPPRPRPVTDGQIRGSDTIVHRIPVGISPEQGLILREAPGVTRGGTR